MQFRLWTGFKYNWCTLLVVEHAGVLTNFLLSWHTSFPLQDCVCSAQSKILALQLKRTWKPCVEFKALFSSSIHSSLELLLFTETYNTFLIWCFTALYSSTDIWTPYWLSDRDVMLRDSFPCIVALYLSLFDVANGAAVMQVTFPIWSDNKLLLYRLV